MGEIYWAFGLAGLAGLVRYLQVFTSKKDERPPWEWSIAAIKLLTGGLVGVLTLWLVGKKVEEGYVYFAIAIAGYGGAETLVFFQQLFRDALSRAASKDEPPKS